MNVERETLTVAEAAAILGIGQNQCYEAARRGEIPCIRIGGERRAGRVLIPRAALERMLAAARTVPGRDNDDP